MNIEQTFRDLLNDRPAWADFFRARGLPSDADDPRAAKITLKSALAFKRIDANAFQREAEAWLADQSVQLSPEGDPAQSELLVRIPCVVQLPVEEALNRHLATHAPNLQHSTALVEFGGDWLSALMQDNHPQVVIGAGVEGMVNLAALRDEYRAPQEGPLNGDFAGMEDPHGLFRLLSGIPLVFVVDAARLNGRKMPESFAELLSGAFEKEVAYPDDGHMLDGILLYYFYQAGGFEMVDRLRAACVTGAHPSQMIKFGGLAEHPTVMVMPHIFATIKAREPGMRVIWPREGAPIIPLVMCVRRDLSPEAEAAAAFFTGPEFGRIMVEQGMFPSSHPQVDNHLPGKLWFPGWEALYRAGLPDLIPRIKRRFLEGCACG